MLLIYIVLVYSLDCYCLTEGKEETKGSTSVPNESPPSFGFGNRKLTGHVFDFPEKECVDKSFKVPWFHGIEASLKSGTEEFMDTDFELLFNYTVVCVNKNHLFGITVRTTDSNVLSAEGIEKVIIECRNSTTDSIVEASVNSDLPSIHNMTTPYSFLDGQIHVQLVSGVLGKTFLEFVMEEIRNTTSNDAGGRIEVAKYPVTVVKEAWPVEIVFTVIIYCTQVVEMFSLGIRVDLDIVREHIWRPVAPIIVLCCQFVLMPVISFAVTKGIGIDNKLVALGIFISGCCPASEGTNMYSFLLKGNLSLSLTMTVISNIIAIGMVPLWVLTLGNAFVEDQELVIPFPMIAVTLSILITPVVIGIVLRQRHPALASGISKWILLKPAILSMSLLLIGLSIWSNLYILRLMEPLTVVMACVLPYALSVIGGIIALVFKQPWKIVKTVAIETSMPHIGYAYVIMTSSFTSPEGDIGAVAPLAVAVISAIPIFIVTVVYVSWRQLRKKYKAVYQAEDVDHKSKHDQEINDNNKM